MKWTNKIENFFRANRGDRTLLVNRESSIQEITNKIPIDFSLNILVIADTHGCLNECELPDDGYDVCFLLGDVFNNDLAIIKQKIVHAPIYGILGNHDGFDLLDRYGIENIHGKSIEIKGVKIVGLQGSIKYKNSDMPLYTDEESCEIAKLLPCADILISHDSPKYVFGDKDFAHSGLQGITNYCELHNVPLNIHGHHHENKTTILENGTTSICCYGVRLMNCQSLN